MNFVDTAITLLHEAGKAVGVQQLCEQALERGMLDKPGANPLRSMKTRLTVELKKGADSRLEKVGDDEWILCEGVELPEGAEDFLKAKPAKKSRAKKDGEAKPKAAAQKASKAKGDEAEAPKKDSKAKKSRAKVKKAEAVVDEGEEIAASDETAPDSAVEEPEEVVAEPEVELTPEEKALVELYSDEEQGTMSAAVLNEYSDGQTKDEDRLMLPEIRPERKPRQRRERRDRKSRRKRRDRGEQETPFVEAGTASGELRDISGAPIEVARAKGVPGEEIVRLALQVLATLPPGQSMPVRQLTQTMIRNGLIEGKADRMWRMVKGTLLAAEQRRRTRGLGAKVRYHGRDLFSAATSEGRSVLSAAEEALRRAAEDYAEAVEEDYRDRLSKLAPGMLERLAYVYLQTVGWTDIEWIKKVEKSCYGIGTAPGDVEPTMLAVRSGPEPIDRRGVGELRAGMYAKDMASGLLISPVELSDEAREELAKEGGYVRLMTGKGFVTELMAREVGASWKHFQLPSIDQRFLDALLG